MSREARRTPTGRDARSAARVLDDRRQRATLVELGRAGLGVRHLADARRSGADHVSGQPSRTTVAFYRVLGVRQLVQATLLARSGTPEAHTIGAAVDTVHAISMLPLMLLDRRRRGIALSQFGIALGLAAAEVLLVGTARPRRR